jgi:hypothetical protein
LEGFGPIPHGQPIGPLLKVCRILVANGAGCAGKNGPIGAKCYQFATKINRAVRGLTRGGDQPEFSLPISTCTLHQRRPTIFPPNSATACGTSALGHLRVLLDRFNGREVRE